MKNKIVIYAGNTLLAIGLKHFLSNTFGAVVTIVHSTAELTDKSADECDFIITDADYFVANLSFFLPRKSKCLIITGHDSATSVDISTLCMFDAESEIIDFFNTILSDNDQHEDEQNKLSQREIDVLRLVASGLINKEIADRLNISINTVLSHRKNITAKLGIKSVSGLSFYAMMNGIIEPETL